MSTAGRLAGFGALLAASLGLGLGLGAVLGPLEPEAPAHTVEPTGDMPAEHR